MPANLSLLMPDFKVKVETLLANCQTRGITMRPYDGLRDPFSQARLWRQSRSGEQIQLQILKFENQGANFLAHCLRSVGPQQGKHVTNALPGLSWHQWGEAVDCFWLVNGEAEWGTRRLIDGQNGYQVYVEEAANLDLDAGGLWNSFKDWPHVQLRNSSSPLRIFPIVEIDRVMRERFL